MLIALTSSNCSSTLVNNTTSKALVGWVPQNSGRGTLDIISSCLLTVLICTWTTIHPRIHISTRLASWHKWFQLIKMILAPEMVCLESLQEWMQAKKLTRRTTETTGGGLHLIHAYYIGMMGIRYKTATGWSVLWPSQYAWLLKQNLISWEDRESWGIEEKTIHDKNKADGLVKLATVWQVVWFTLQCITRAANNVPIAPLEAMTLAYVGVALLTYGFWWKKPKDIATASFIELPSMTAIQRDTFNSLTMEDTYDTNDIQPITRRNAAWYLIARDYEEDNIARLLGDAELPRGSVCEDTRHWWSRISSKKEVAASEAQRSMNRLARAIPLPRPALTRDAASADPRIITEWDATLYMSRWWPMICLLGAAFGALHLISWNSSFPTRFELWLWRSSALASIVTSILCMQFRAISLRWEGPSTIFRLGSPLLYIFSRVVMTGEVFAALRAMPAETYDTSVVWDYWFHFS